MADCKDKESAWMAKLQEATDLYGNLEFIGDEAERNLEGFTEDMKDIYEGWWTDPPSSLEDIAKYIIDSWDSIKDGLDREEYAQEIADEASLAEEAYELALKESDELLDELCDCERENANIA